MEPDCRLAMRLARRHEGHDMDTMDMSMSGMDDMGGGMAAFSWYPQIYWIFVGCVIAAFALANVSNHVLYQQRMRTLSKGGTDALRPNNLFSRGNALLTALVREISNFSLPNLSRRIRILGYTPPSPSVGSIYLVIVNAVLLIILAFYRLDPTNYDNYQNIAYRLGFITLGQLPLVFLLAGKESIIGFFTGHSYERLNWLHRWVSRCVLLTATLHMGFWFGNWAPYDYIGYQIKNDRTFTQTGFSAWCVLLWIVISSVAPIRNLGYEFFVIQHLLSFTAFIALVFLHTPASDHAWLWVPVGLFFFDRIVRAGWMAYSNLSIFHRKSQGSLNSPLACHAKLTPISGGMTRVTIRHPPHSWKPGQHVFLSIFAATPLQMHPFTIASLPSDNKMEFLIKARGGGTKRFLRYAERKFGLPSAERNGPIKGTVPCAISESFGNLRPLRQFDSVVLLAGSTGATFTIPLLRDLVQQWKSQASRPHSAGRSGSNHLQTPPGAVTRRVRFIWAIKSGEHISWFAEQLQNALVDVQELREQGLDVRLSVSIYVTCDDTFTSEWNTSTKKETLSDDPTSRTRITSTSPYSASENSTIDEKKEPSRDQTLNVREIDPRSDSIGSSNPNDAAKPKACGPDGTCCCQTTVVNESSAPAVVCSCNCNFPASAPSTSTEKDPVKLLARSIAILSGRPHPRTIIRRVLEQARGESAVVSCGPHGMNNDVRRAVVGLSDERAAGRSTGAMGVWFWGEGFGW